MKRESLGWPRNSFFLEQFWHSPSTAPRSARRMKSLKKRSASEPWRKGILMVQGFMHRMQSESTMKPWIICAYNPVWKLSLLALILQLRYALPFSAKTFKDNAPHTPSPGPPPRYSPQWFGGFLKWCWNPKTPLKRGTGEHFFCFFFTTHLFSGALNKNLRPCSYFTILLDPSSLPPFSPH